MANVVDRFYMALFSVEQTRETSGGRRLRCVTMPVWRIWRTDVRHTVPDALARCGKQDEKGPSPVRPTPELFQRPSLGNFPETRWSALILGYFGRIDSILN